jgi:hypothetical protein
MTEFSRIYDLSLSTVFVGPQSITASIEECHALARRFRILGIDSLNADFRLFHDTEDQCFRLKGTLESTLTQSSVISLTPVTEVIRAPLHVKIRLGETSQHDDENLDDIDDIDVEYVSHTKVDIGEIIAQYLSLSMDPYPKTNDEKKRDRS